jgi:hypothetical protein
MLECLDSCRSTASGSRVPRAIGEPGSGVRDVEVLRQQSCTSEGSTGRTACTGGRTKSKRAACIGSCTARSELPRLVAVQMPALVAVELEADRRVAEAGCNVRGAQDFFPLRATGGWGQDHLEREGA